MQSNIKRLKAGESLPILHLSKWDLLEAGIDIDSVPEELIEKTIEELEYFYNEEADGGFLPCLKKAYFVAKHLDLDDE